MKDTILVLIISVLWTSCTPVRKQEPERISGIPENAFWTGGSDGGSWFVIRKIDKDLLTAYIVIYNENTAEIETERLFKLKCNSEKEFAWGNLKEEIMGFDGQKIILKQIDKENRNCYFE